MEQTPVAHPPMFSVEAEKSVLGGLITRPDLADVVSPLLQDWMFYREGHRRIWRAMRALHEKQAVIDGLSIQDRLTATGDLDAAGGMPYLAELADWVPHTTEQHMGYHAQIIRRHATRRRIHEQAAAVQDFVRSHPDAEPELMQAEVERLISEAMPGQSGADGFTLIGEHLWAEMERLERLKEGEDVVRGVKTGLKAIDDRLLSMQRGDLVIAAGRPSMGKSALGLCNIAADAAIRQRHRVAFFTLETRKDAIMRRLLASESRVNLWAAQKRRRLLDHDYPSLSEAAGPLKAATLHVHYAPGLTLDRMRAALRDLTREHGAPDLVVVDYLQLMSHPKARGGYEEVSAISKGLKEVAGEFGVVMVALSQLSRAVEQRPDKRPMMADLRESGRLEQDADVIMLLYRPEYYFPNGMPVKVGKETQTMNVQGKAEIILAKVREGETGTAHCAWEGAFTHFENLRGDQ